MCPVQSNQLGTGFGSRGRSVGLVPSVTPLGKLSAPLMGARGAIWAHIQIIRLQDPLFYPSVVRALFYVYIVFENDPISRI